MLASIDIKLIGVVGLIFIIIIGYFVYSLYKDLVFLKNEVSELGNTMILQEPWNSVDGEAPKTDEEEDRELEEHLASFMNSQEYVEEEPSSIQEIHEEPVLLEEPKVKKRKYNKKKLEPVVEQPEEIEI